MKQAKGFTLIELLVVVLIIGILAAIAVPQYRVAVEKSRAVEALSWMRHSKILQEEYHLANGKYAFSTEAFETFGLNSSSVPNYSLQFADTYIALASKKPSYAYVISYFYPGMNTTPAAYQKRTLCAFKKDNSLYKKLCLSLCSDKTISAYQYLSTHDFCYID